VNFQSSDQLGDGVGVGEREGVKAGAGLLVAFAANGCADSLVAEIWELIAVGGLQALGCAGWTD